MHLSKLKHLLFLLFFISISQLTFSQFKLTDKLVTDPDVKIGKLPNGLTYYIKRNTKPEKKLQLRLVVNTGSVLEQPDQQGLAHMMEHMNFNGSKHFQKNELVNYLQSIGVQFGADLNAYTSFDETVYILPIPSDDMDKVDKGFTILEDWAGNALLDTAEINKERGVVLEESRLGKGANERMGKKYYPLLYNGSPYASRLPIGKDSIIQNFKAESLIRFYKTWYRPDLEAVVVVGDIDPKVALEEIIKHFGQFKNPAPEIVRPSIIPIAERKQDMGMVLSDKEQTFKILQIFNYVEKAKPVNTWSAYRETVVEGLFNALINQRLNELTQQADPPFIFGSSSFGGFSRGYRSFVSIAAIGDKPVNDAINALVATNESVRKYGFLKSELERGKMSMLNQTETAFKDKDKTESAVLVQGYINNYLTGSPVVGITNRFAFIKQVLPTITLDEVNAVAKKMETSQGKFALYLSPEKDVSQLPSNTELIKLLASAHRVPAKAYQEKAVANSLMDKKPVAGKVISEKKNATLGTTDLTLSNGVTITLRPTDFKNDEIQMDSWRWGGTHNYGLADKENAQNAAIIVQQMGVKDMTPTDLEKFLSGKTVSAQPYMNPDDEGIQGTSSIKDLETMLQLVNLYFTQPRKDDKLFQSFINTQKGFIRNLRDNPGNYFSDTLAKTEYNNNPWAGGLPKAADYDKISLERVTKIYNEVYGNAYGLHFTFVGNIDPDKIKPLLETYLGSLPSKQKENKFTDVGLRPVKGVVELSVNKGAAKQSRVSVIFTGEAPYSQDENLKITALTEVLNIKIIEKLREEMSLIYGGGMGGSLVKRPYPHYSISAGFPCAPENVDKVIAAFFGIIKNAQDNGVEQKDLDKVKETLKKQNEDELKNNDHWLTVLSESWIEREDPIWIYNYGKKVQALTIQDIQQAAKKYLNNQNYIKAVLNPEK
ncbi:MAG: insulinase family protein [Chitinophagaceae bacterium]|nr:insulinase family protein [Chitinophagaceae bacterium]